MQMDRIFHQRLSTFRTHCKSMADAACYGTATSGSRLAGVEEKIAAAITSIYLKKVSALVDECIALAQSRVSTRKLTRDQTKSSGFNYGYIPLLEHFFEENPFPTRADKSFLAKKSGMTYRQIHVWFQNRRNRSKKDGRILRRKPIGEGATLPLGPLCQRMKKYIMTGHKVHEVKVSSWAQKSGRNGLRDRRHTFSGESTNPPQSPEPIQVEHGNVLVCSLSPPHAFPSLYPPCCSYDPFPVKKGLHVFESPDWHRRCISVPICSKAPDLDELIERFSQLCVRDARPYDTAPCTAATAAATCAITVVPSSAPHPALIRSMADAFSLRPSLVPLPSVPASTLRLCAFRTFSSPKAFLAPNGPALQVLPGKSETRKFAPLPLHAPRSPPSSRHSSLSLTGAEVSPPCSSSCRGSSAEADVFTSCRIRSRCSSSDTSPPTSPQFSPQYTRCLPLERLMGVSQLMPDLLA